MKHVRTAIVRGVICLAALGIWVTTVGANPAPTINVTVTIQNVSVTASGPIAFGVVLAGSTTVSSSHSDVVNDGNVTETYSLKLTNPGGWTAKQAAPGVAEYCLSAQFNSDDAGTFSYLDHALTTTDSTCSASKFAGDETGLSVVKTGARSLWFKFQAPSSTTVWTEQTITVTITATAD